LFALIHEPRSVAANLHLRYDAVGTSPYRARR
jgi:hypothetical protein